MDKKISSLAFKGIAMAMGVAVIVITMVGRLAPKDAASWLGIGLAAPALDALQKE